MTHLVMFDIDGTLVDSMRVDSHLYSRAVRETLGRRLYRRNVAALRSRHGQRHPRRNPRAAWLRRLAAIGVSIDGVGFASSSDAHERTKIMELAAERALGGVVPKTRTYFGDGAWDQRASAALGYRFIAIGRALEHEPRFDDYANRDAVLACLAV